MTHEVYTLVLIACGVGFALLFGPQAIVGIMTFFARREGIAFRILLWLAKRGAFCYSGILWMAPAWMPRGVVYYMDGDLRYYSAEMPLGDAVNYARMFEGEVHHPSRAFKGIREC